jgi:hypothetical protein
MRRRVSQRGGEGRRCPQFLRNARYRNLRGEAGKGRGNFERRCRVAWKHGGLWQIPRVKNVNAGSRVVFHVTRDQNEIVSQRGCCEL